MTNVVDILAAKPPSLGALLNLCPDQPLADVDEIELGGMTAKEHAKWWIKAADLRMRYPGYQEAYWYREHMKYGHCFGRGPLPDRPLPRAGAPLNDFVQARISHAKAGWSRDVSAGRTQLQFREWLKLYVNGETWLPPLWPDGSGWSEALQLLRIACGLPSVDPAITWKLRPPPPARRVRR